jgi:beta-lactam-binding protein with PASTA domain
MARRPVPADLEDALARNPAARERFWSLPPEQVDRWVSYVERARFPGARRRRIAEAVRRLGGAPAPAVAETRGAGPAAVALPRDDLWTWVVGILLLAALAAFLVWLTVLRDRHHHNAGPSAVVVTAKSTVPKLTGIRLESAEFQLRQEKLRSHVVRRTGKKPKGIVLDQAPKANKRVVQGSVVTLVVSKGLPGVKVPKLVGLAAADAVHQLQKLGLSATLKQQPAQATPGSVVQQTPAAGKRAKKGTPVTLVVAKGAAAFAVPDVRGKSQQDASNALQQQGLNVRVVEVVSTQPTGTVLAQNPPPQTKVQQGATVRINVAKGAPQPQQTTPTTTRAATTTTTPVQQTPGGNDYRGMRLSPAVQKIAQGRQQVVVQYVTSTQPAGVVVANSNAGSRVKLQVSAGSQPQPATSVPDTTGEDAPTAQSDLAGAGFKVLTVQWPVSDPASDGVVVWQTPGSAPPGSTVVLFVGNAS